MAYACGGFWTKVAVYYEQPAITPTTDTYIYAQTVPTSNTTAPSTPIYYMLESAPIVFTSDATMNLVVDPFVRSMSVRVWSVDNDFDGVVDCVVVNVSVPLLDTEALQRIRFVFGIQYELNVSF